MADNETKPSKQPPMAGKRSRSGCLTCRKRKKKCDETLCEETGGCWRCRNAGYQCEGFRRAPVVFEPGSSSTSRSKRIKRSPDTTGTSLSTPTQAEDGPTNAASTSSAYQTSPIDTTPSDNGHRLPNSLAELAGIATSSEAWSLMDGLAGSQDVQVRTQFSSSSYPNGATSSLGPLLGQTDQLPSSQPCEIVGDCLFSGRHLCSTCSAVANRLVDPETSQLSHLDPSIFPTIPSLSTPLASRHQSPAPADATSLGQGGAALRSSQMIMESLIGYYSTLITCWAQGCDAKGLDGSSLFRSLVPYLLERTNRDTPLRLSIAAVTAGYVGGARLSWPPDVVAIHQWATNLRSDRSSLAECVSANLSFPPASTPDSTWSGSPGDGSISGLSSRTSAARRRRSTHATLDDLLVGQAQTLKQLAICSLEEAVTEHCSQNQRAPGLKLTEKGFLAEVARVNSMLLAALNIAIYAFAEESIESFFEEAGRMRSLVDRILGIFPVVDLSKLTSLDHFGFRTYAWCDISMAIARGTSPHLQLVKPSLDAESPMASASVNNLLDSVFSLPEPLMIALSEIARLRFNYDGGDYSATAQRAMASAVPAWVHDRAEKILVQIEACQIPSTLSAGSMTCARMIKEACKILIYTLVYRYGAIHATIRSSLKRILELWTSSGERYCRSVGCSNYNIPIFVAASVAVGDQDRQICAKAMQMVGHEEAGPASGRALIHELWRRVDATGLPCFWTDLVATGEYGVAFF